MQWSQRGLLEFSRGNGFIAWFGAGRHEAEGTGGVPDGADVGAVQFGFGASQQIFEHDWLIVHCRSCEIIAQIGEGTDEVQQMVIARALGA